MPKSRLQGCGTGVPPVAAAHGRDARATVRKPARGFWLTGSVPDVRMSGNHDGRSADPRGARDAHPLPTLPQPDRAGDDPPARGDLLPLVRLELPPGDRIDHRLAPPSGPSA